MAREKIIGIYKITNPKGKIYIGLSKNVLHRWNEYKLLRCKTQCRLYNSLKKYGVDKHKFEIIHECIEEQLTELEDYYIKLYNTFNTEQGLNLVSGGSHIKMSEETKQKISKTLTGKRRSIECINKLKIAFKNRKRSEETNIKRINSLNALYASGHISGNKGKIMSEETKNKISKTMKGRPSHKKGVKLSEETKIKMSKPVVQLSLNNKFICSFESGVKATKLTGISSLGISRCCNNTRKQSGGFKWMFLKDYESKNLL